MSAVRRLSLLFFVFAVFLAAVLLMPPQEGTGSAVRLTIGARETPISRYAAAPRVLDSVAIRLAQTDYSPVARITILPDLGALQSSPSIAQPPATNVAAKAENSTTEVIFPDPAPRNRAAFAALRLKAALDGEMLTNFDLFLYVSKAEHGPLAQRMIVFRKEGAEDLSLVYDWAASTGREQQETSPRGRKAFTATPRGYYQLDPRRMYRSYHSYNWDQPMPHAMFFDWERKGLQTGLAIHAAGSQSSGKLGQRASAGCVQLSPEHAEILFDLVRHEYRGPVPRFAYNDADRTMSNSGAFMRDRKGRLQMADGYKVLVFIEDFGGKNFVAALNGSSNPL